MDDAFIELSLIELFIIELPCMETLLDLAFKSSLLFCMEAARIDLTTFWRIGII